jgi:hypothetical protein
MYYPKTQIKPNLFTNGGEYILSTTKEEYKGYYYKTSTGQSYTGKNPSNPQSILLEPLIISDAPGLTQNLPNNSEPISIPVAPSIQTSTSSSTPLLKYMPCGQRGHAHFVQRVVCKRPPPL